MWQPKIARKRFPHSSASAGGKCGWGGVAVSTLPKNNPKTHVLCNHTAVIRKFESFWRRNALLEERGPLGHRSDAEVKEMRSVGLWGGSGGEVPSLPRSRPSDPAGSTSSLAPGWRYGAQARLCELVCLLHCSPLCKAPCPLLLCAASCGSIHAGLHAHAARQCPTS